MNEESLMNYHMTCQWFFFSISSRESFHLSFVLLQLLKNNGRSWRLRQHLPLWPSSGRMCLHWAQEKGRVGWGAPQISQDPALFLFSLHGDEWRHLMNPLDGIWIPAAFTHSTDVAQWSVATFETLVHRSGTAGGLQETSREREGWLLEPGCGENRRAPESPSRAASNRTKKNHHKQRFGAGMATVQPSCPARSSGRLEWARAQCGHGSEQTPCEHPLRLPWKGCKPGPYLSIMWTLVVFSFPVAIPLPTLSPSEFCGTGPSPNSWSGLWARPIETHGAQF